MSEADSSEQGTQGVQKHERNVVIDRDGDVYLELPDLELRVSSKALSMASKVFTAMFSSNFQEGLHLAERETCRIPLPEDDLTAMRALCKLMHHQELSSPDSEMTACFLRKVAILADKYACKGAVKFWADVWIGRLTGKLRGTPEDEKDIVNLLLIAYILDLSPQFTAITKRMVYWAPKCSSLLCKRGWPVDSEVQGYLPQGLIGEPTRSTRKLLSPLPTLVDLLDTLKTLVATITHVEKRIKLQLMGKFEDLAMGKLKRLQYQGEYDRHGSEALKWKPFSLLDRDNASIALGSVRSHHLEAIESCKTCKTGALLWSCLAADL